MFDQLGVLEYLGISDEKMMAFLEAVAKRYQPNPYHHFTHAFTLTQGCYWAVRKDKSLASHFSIRDLTAMLIAGFGHDLDHRKP